MKGRRENMWGNEEKRKRKGEAEDKNGKQWTNCS
jgi:hypothetical protein